jgi:nanoRNase/pAp phosphatase (c-di-AMP/oligoRNAs hydrolase)
MTSDAVSAAILRRRPSRAKGAAVRRLLASLAGKQQILITTHMYPDPDALASSKAVLALLRAKCPEAHVTMSIKGELTGGINEGFARLSDFELDPWDDASLSRFDAIVLLDCQPSFAYSPLPEGTPVTAVIDHHRIRGRKPTAPFVDIRSDIGAASTIAHEYMIDAGVEIAPGLAASLLYAIESDITGVAGTPNELDTFAVAQLMVLADARKLHQMRHAPLPAAFFTTLHHAIANARFAAPLLVTHLGDVRTPEMPAVIADWMLRFDQIDWALVSARHDNRLLLSLRTHGRLSAGEAMRKLVGKLGEGGGHRTKAGGFIRLGETTDDAVACVHDRIRKRAMRLFDIPATTPFEPLLT